MANKPSALPKPVGVIGLRQFSGYIREEFLLNLQGMQGMRTFEEMSLNDSTCGAVLFAIKNLIRGMVWRVEPSDADDADAVEAAKLLEDMLFNDMYYPWSDFLESVCSMFTYGYSVFETVWKKRQGNDVGKPWLSSDFDDGLYAPAYFAPRSQKTIYSWIYDDEEHLVGFEQTPFNGPMIKVPMSRCMHFRTSAELDNPEGRSILRTAYRSWYWLKRLQEIEGIGTERDLAGYPVLRVPGIMLSGAATPEMVMARQGYEDLLRKIRRDQNEGVLLPSDRDENGNLHYEFELMSAGGSRQLRIDESITRYQKDIARSVLADFIFLGADGGGSLALGVEKVSVFVKALQTYAKSIADEINNEVVSQVWLLNGLDVELRPTLVATGLEDADLAGLSAYVKALSDIGFDLSVDQELEQYLRRAADLPPAPEREEGEEDFTEEPDPDTRSKTTADEDLDDQEAAIAKFLQDKAQDAASREEVRKRLAVLAGEQ